MFWTTQVQSKSDESGWTRNSFTYFKYAQRPAQNRLMMQKPAVVCQGSLFCGVDISFWLLASIMGWRQSCRGQLPVVLSVTGISFLRDKRDLLVIELYIGGWVAEKIASVFCVQGICALKMHLDSWFCMFRFWSWSIWYLDYR